MLQITPFTSTPAGVWPIPGDAPDLRTIVQDQARTIADKEVLLHAYQAVLNAAQANAPATGTGNATGTSTLTMTAVTGTILLGATVAGTGVPAGTTITAQQSGTVGGAGVYTTSAILTLTNVALTFSPGGGAMPWPSLVDAVDLNSIMLSQTAVLRSQTALVQQYQDLLNTSSTPAPPTGP